MIQNKRRGIPIKGVLLHDNSKPNFANATKHSKGLFRWNVLIDLSHCSPSVDFLEGRHRWKKGELGGGVIKKLIFTSSPASKWMRTIMTNNLHMYKCNFICIFSLNEFFSTNKLSALVSARPLYIHDFKWLIFIYVYISEPLSANLF